MQYTLEDRKPELRGSEHYIAPSADVIGSVVMEDRSSVWFNAVLRGDNEPIYLGEETNIQDCSVLHTEHGCPVVLGRGVTVGHLAMVHGCTVGDYSLIGIKAVILDRARIGKHCLIGANALVTDGKEIPDRSLVLGSPGKVVRTLTDEEVEKLHAAARSYVNKMRRYSTGLASLG
ncbi:MAG TPA: gamma carbonic anhydrase family protein [Arenicellales bacterium]|nr:gamma carbonic anhydrase family protein [Arenicellales bacterium]